MHLSGDIYIRGSHKRSLRSLWESHIIVPSKRGSSPGTCFRRQAAAYRQSPWKQVPGFLNCKGVSRSRPKWDPGLRASCHVARQCICREIYTSVAPTSGVFGACGSLILLFHQNEEVAREPVSTSSRQVPYNPRGNRFPGSGNDGSRDPISASCKGVSRSGSKWDPGPTC